MTEVDLCGHATLASAHVLFHHLGYSEQARQISKRGGSISCELKGERIFLSGQAVTFMEGVIQIEPDPS